MTPAELDPWETELTRIISRLDSGSAAIPDDEIRGFLTRFPEHGRDLREALENISFLDSRIERITGERSGDARDASGTPTDSRGLPTIRGFEIVELIGRGGMGVVYRARDVFLQRDVAIKLIHEGLHDDRARHRFLREARIVARLKHDHIIPVHAAGEIGDRPYLVMELADGMPLHRYAEQFQSPTPGNSAEEPAVEARDDGDDGPTEPQPTVSGLPPQVVARIGAQVADGLAYAHECGVIHRDIKPANICVSTAGHVQLMDFGLSRPVLDNTDTPTSPATAATRFATDQLSVPGELIGTPSYLAPELIEGRSASERSDIYSLGVTLYQLLSGRLPFEASSHAALFFAITSRPVKALRHVNSHIPVDLEAVVLQAMERNPAERYWSAADLRDDLRRFLQGEPVQARRYTPWARALRLARRHSLICAAIFVAAVVVFGFAVRRQTQPRVHFTSEPESARVTLRLVGREPGTPAPAVIDLPMASPRVLPAGTYRLQAEAPGHYPLEIDRVRLASGRRFTRHLELRSQAPIWRILRGLESTDGDHCLLLTPELPPFLIALSDSGDLVLVNGATGARVQSVPLGTLLAMLPSRPEIWTLAPYTRPFVRQRGASVLVTVCLIDPAGSESGRLATWRFPGGQGALGAPRLLWSHPVWIDRRIHQGTLGDDYRPTWVRVSPPGGNESTTDDAAETLIFANGRSVEGFDLISGERQVLWEADSVAPVLRLRLRAIERRETDRTPFVILHSQNGRTFVIDVDARREHWRIDHGSRVAELRVADLDGDGTDDLALASYASLRGGAWPYSLGAIDVETKRSLWTREIVGASSTVVALLDVVPSNAGVEVILGNRDGSLRVLAGRNGEDLTTFGANVETAGHAFGPLEWATLLPGSPGRGEELLLVLGERNVISAFSTETRRLAWTLQAPMVTHAPALVRDLNGDGFPEILLLGDHGSMAALPAPWSRVRWSVPWGFRRADAPVVIDADGDGIEDVVSHGEAGRAVALCGLDGRVLWRAPAGTTLIGALRVEGREDAILVAQGQRSFAVLDPPSGRQVHEIQTGPCTDFCLLRTGKSRQPELLTFRAGNLESWQIDSGELAYRRQIPDSGNYTPLRAGDYDDDGQDEVIVTISLQKVMALDLGEDRILWEKPSPVKTSTGMAPELLDLDGDGETEVLLQEELGAFGAYRAVDGQPIWRCPAHVGGSGFADRARIYFKSQPSLWVGREGAHPADPAERAVHAPDAENGREPRFLAASDSAGAVYLLEAASGVPRWVRSFGESVPEVVLAELSGDALPDMIVPLRNRQIHVLDGSSGDTLWHVSLPGGTVWRPAVADLEGDGEPEIVVATDDGRVVVLSCRGTAEG